MQLMTMREKQILARAIEIHKKIGSNHATIILKTVKYKEMYGVLFKNEAFLSLKNAWLPPVFFLDTKNTLPSSAFSAWF